jgi:UDP-glucose:(heptosyl)LPS alpha-1,3-glucosyltransferase
LKSLARLLSPGKQLGRIVERLCALTTPVLVANSEFVRDLTVKAYPCLKSESIGLIYNKPDLSRFFPGDPARKPQLRGRFDLPENADLVVTAGTNFRLKGVHVLIRSLAQLPPSFHLAVAGGRGSRELLGLAESLGVQGRVHFLGRVDDMPSLLQAGDIFVLNTFYDACANAVLEALACGLPTISTTSNGSSVFLHSKAVVDDPTDDAHLAERIRALIHNGTTARTDYNPPSGLEPYIDLLREFS